MVRSESSQRAMSLLPFLQPSDHSPRLALTEGTSDSSYPFALVDDSAPFSRVIMGSFLTDAGSRLKNVFLVLQRDMYRQNDTIFSTVTNLTIEAGWLGMPSVAATADIGDELISLTADSCDNEKMRVFAPLLFCREKKLFMPLLCPSCARELELCHDDELLLQKGLHPYSTSIRRYLYCPSCCSSEFSEFYVRERECADPLFLLDGNDLIHRLRLIAESGVDSSRFPCASCTERDTCFGSANSVRSRLSPFSFFPFHLLIVDAPTLNVLDFIALLSGSTPGALAEQLDRRAFPGRVSSLNSIDNSGSVKWTIFAQGDERALPELLFLKLSLLEEVVGRIVANAHTSLRGERVWVYLPKVCRNLPIGWNFKLLFIDDLTPDVSVHEIEHNLSSALARTGLFFFQILLSSRNVGDNSIVEVVSRYFSDITGTGGETRTSCLQARCAPANIFSNSDGYVLNRQFEGVWGKACAVGFELLDMARNKSSMRCTEIHHSLHNLLEETRLLLFSNGQMESEATATDSCIEQEKLTMIRRIVSEMIVSTRTEIQQGLPVPPDDRYGEVVETVILRAAAPLGPLSAPEFSSIDADATVIIPTPMPVQEWTSELASVEEKELLETVCLSSQHVVQQFQKEPGLQHPFSAQPPAEQQTPEKPSQEQDELAETVMISAPTGRHRPGSVR